MNPQSMEPADLPWTWRYGGIGYGQTPEGLRVHRVRLHLQKPIIRGPTYYTGIRRHASRQVSFTQSNGRGFYRFRH